MRGLAAAATALALALGGCQCAQNSCELELCYGCCDTAGVCRAGTSLTQCGVSGARCVSCASGEACHDGTCIRTRVEPDAGRCNNISCMRGTSCDEGDGVCRCGGVTCGSDDYCDAGQCTRIRDGGFIPCNPGTCRGCCVSGDTCASGTTGAQCGFGGQACQPCLPPGVCQNGFCFGAMDAGFCGPQTCAGCCQGQTCLPGFDSMACGFGGRPCQFCGGGLCSAGSCFFPDAGPLCGPQTCAGCCQGVMCFAGSDPMACGFGGRPCQFCGGGVCSAGSCFFPDAGPSCGPTNCAGCCIGGFCQPGFDSFACGRFGNACLSCPAGTVCSPDAGFCVSTCNSANCPSGCCQNGVCMMPNDATCGRFGSQCSDCRGFGHCDAGVCQASCAFSCAGCCAGETCVDAPQQGSGACGHFGAACQPCTAPAACQMGMCFGPDGGVCTPQTCNNGCCDSAECHTTRTDQVCGDRGAACAACPPGQTCQFGVCNPVADAGSCGPMSCPGCCSGGACGPGFTDAFCGHTGAVCATCDTSGGQGCVSVSCLGLYVGASCSDAGCAGGLACRQDYPDGYCTEPCAGGCPGGIDLCMPYDGGFECRSRCGPPFGTCRAGYSCVAAGSDAGVCEP